MGIYIGKQIHSWRYYRRYLTIGVIIMYKLTDIVRNLRSTM